jgi:diaminohydroxyphosphoribosylaminopyrimidine deaminase/5-amino-6-(5-phosphoribosylamino)uracil reductase
MEIEKMRSEDLMVRAIELAKKGAGYVSPNPLVGALIVKDDKVISEGWHKKFGSLHAEIDAIENAGAEDLTGATMVVNLEPCTHYGKQPPCAPEIIKRGFSKVIIGMTDPNPEICGKGIEELRDSGIEVETDVLLDECLKLNRFFVKRIVKQRPYVIAKAGLSMDGCIATHSGNSKWITCEESRRRVHILRSQVDAVLIGKNTAAKDNPKLNVRNVAGRNPKRVVIDTHLTLPLELEMFKDGDRNNTIICCCDASAVTRKADNLRMAGVKIMPCGLSDKGEIVLDCVLFTLASQFSIGSVLVEGGASMFSSFLKEDLIDELKLYQAPILIGKGLGMFDDAMPYYVKDASKFKFVDIGWSGEDIEITAIRNKENE